MKRLSVIFAVLWSILPMSAQELPVQTSNTELVTTAIARKKEFDAHRKELIKMVARHNRIVTAEWDDADISTSGGRIYATQAPFGKCIADLSERIKGGKLADFPGILELGEVTLDPDSGKRTLTVFVGYGRYEDGRRLFPRYRQFKFDAEGNLIEAGKAPVPETN